MLSLLSALLLVLLLLVELSFVQGKNLVLLQLAAKTLAIDVVRGKCDHLLQNGRVESTVTNEASPQGNKGLRETR